MPTADLTLPEFQKDSKHELDLHHTFSSLLLSGSPALCHSNVPRLWTSLGHIPACAVRLISGGDESGQGSSSAIGPSIGAASGHVPGSTQQQQQMSSRDKGRQVQQANKFKPQDARQVSVTGSNTDVDVENNHVARFPTFRRLFRHARVSCAPAAPYIYHMVCRYSSCWLHVSFSSEQK